MTTLNLTETQVDINLHLKDSILPNRSWDLIKLKTIIPAHIINSIKDIPIPLSSIPNEPIWGPSPSGLFTVKSANRLAHNLPSIKEKMASLLDLESWSSFKT